MTNISRVIGNNIFLNMRNKDMNIHDLAEKLQYSEKDLFNVIEGKKILSPVALQNIANVLNVTKKDLLYWNPNSMTPELQYLEKFDNPDNLETILDLIDEYVVCRESV